MSKPDPKVYAFWRNDTFPYALGSMGAFNELGNFYAHKYDGTWHRDKIIEVYPSIAQGEQIIAALERLGGAYRAELKKLNAEYQKQAEQILPALKKDKP